MKRSFNYTGRVRIPKEWVHLDLSDADGGVRAAGRIAFPAPEDFGQNAQVLLYFRRGAARAEVEAGTVQREVRFDRTFAEFPDAEGLSMDVRVYDAADPARKLLGLARTVRGGEGGGARLSLLAARSGDFSYPVWRLDMDFDTGPFLEFSRRCRDFRKLALSGEFVALVLPGVVGLIARELLLGDGAFNALPDADDDDRRSLWMSYLNDLPGVPSFRGDETRDQREELVAAYEEAFATKARVFERARNLLQIDEEEADG